MTTATTVSIHDAHDFANFLAWLLDTRVRVGLCACCADPRPMLRFGSDTDGEWMHADDETYAEVRHVHVSTSSRDCDGLYDHGHVYRIPSIRPEALRPLHLRNTPDQAPDFSDLWLYLARHEPPMYRECTIECESERVRWHAPTDEGFESGSMWACSDPWCAHDESTFRDHTAERAGY